MYQSSPRKRRERYRDLLQASTSIISMAASSEHVVSVLEEMQDMIEDTEPEHRLQRTSVSQKDGTTRSI
jgi:hypothetical protein